MSVYRINWNDGWLNGDIFKSSITFIPDGFDLVEKPSHKKKRLEEQKSEVETWLKYNRKQVVDYEKKLEAIEKELKDL